MFTDPLMWMFFLTVVIVIGFLAWSKMSAKKSMQKSPSEGGIGGKNDPLA